MYTVSSYTQNAKETFGSREEALFWIKENMLYILSFRPTFIRITDPDGNVERIFTLDFLQKQDPLDVKRLALRFEGFYYLKHICLAEYSSPFSLDRFIKHMGCYYRLPFDVKTIKEEERVVV